MSETDNCAVGPDADEASAPPTTAADALAMIRVCRTDQLKLEQRLTKIEVVVEQLRAWLSGKPRRPAPGWRRAVNSTTDRRKR
jgi:hypothetical protein